MQDPYAFSINDPKWARLSKILAENRPKPNGASDKSFEVFIKGRPEHERQEWRDFFAAYSAAQNKSAAEEPVAIERGKRDPIGRNVRRIHVNTDEFIIYCADHVDDEDDLCTLSYWFKPTMSNEKAKEMRVGLCPISAQIARLADAVTGMRPILGDSGRHRRERERAYDLMARAMAFGLEGQQTQAKAILDELEKETTLRRDSQNRMRYIFATTMSFLAIVALGLVLKGIETTRFGAPAIGAEPVKTLVIDVLLFGALGAFFSVVYDIKAVKVHHAISVPEMIYAGAIRIPVGVIAAAVVILLITGDWVLSGLGDVSKSWSLLLLGFLAGFSEMFVPNALKDMEKQSTITKPGDGATAGTNG